MSVLPDDIESPRTKLVYLSLRERGGASVDDLAEELRMPKLSLLSVLKTLRQRGYVDRGEGGYRLL